MRSLLKDLVRVIPESESFSRGKQSIDDVVENARQAGFSIVVVVTGMHGNPRDIRFLQITESSWKWLPKTFVLKSVKLTREFETRSQRTDALDIEDNIGFSESLGLEAEESETLLRATSNSISFFQNNEEIGPRMMLKEVRNEA